MTTPCPCGLPNAYDDCCGRFHAGAPAPSAEALMRSRYCAYVLQLGDYLLTTWHHSTRPGSIDFDEAPKWLGLTVKPALAQKNPGNATLAEPEEANASTVEFIARYKIGGRAYRLHETSRFVRENGRWFYLDGEIH